MEVAETDTWTTGTDWQELVSGPPAMEPLPALQREHEQGPWRRLFTGPFVKGRMRDVGLLVILVWLAMGVLLFFAMQLLGYAYQETLAPHLLSGYTERYVGCWFTALFAVALSFFRMLMIWFRYRFC